MFSGKSRGSALLMAMVVLFIMTLTTSSSLNNALLIKKLITGGKYRESAFQNAELALRSTERELLSFDSMMTLTFTYLSIPGTYSEQRTGLYQDEAFMKQRPLYSVSNGLTRRYVERIGYETAAGGIEGIQGETAALFRVTVMASEDGYDLVQELAGENPRAQVLLQSVVAVNIGLFGVTTMPQNLVRGRQSWRELRFKY